MITENDMTQLRVEMRKLIEPVKDDVANINESLSSLTVTVADQAPVNFAGIVNTLNNSAPEWSKAAYLATGVSPADAGDTNLECYNWFRQPQADTELVQSSANALKTAKTSEPADHTLWAANEGADDDIPRWNKVNAYVEIGGASDRWDLFLPIPNDIIQPGQTFIFQLEAMLASTDPRPDVQLYAGIYDNTAGQRKFIEGGDFTITGSIFGTPGSTTVDYRVLARTDAGEEALSNILTFTNAPAVFDANNHPRISFSGVPGFIQFLIYRKIGSTYVHQYTVGNTIDGTYFDIGNPPIAVVSGWPSVSTTVPRAFAQTTSFLPGSPNGSGWVRHSLKIFVPTTYNRGNTGAGMQYLRFGLTDVTDTARQILIRKLGLSQGDGSWGRSAEDLRSTHSSPSSNPPLSGGGDGDGGIDPPPPPGGGGGCVLLDTKIKCLDKDGSRLLKPLKELRKGDLNRGGTVCGKVKGVKFKHCSTIYWVRTANGLRVGSSATQPFITSETDFNGTELARLKMRFDRGEEVRILTEPKDVIEETTIIDIQEEFGDFIVGSPTQAGSKLFIGNGFLFHNKPIGEGIFF